MRLHTFYLLVILFISVLSCPLYAQKKEFAIESLYIEVGAGEGNFHIAKGSLNFQLSSQTTFSLFYNQYWRSDSPSHYVIYPDFINDTVKKKMVNSKQTILNAYGVTLGRMITFNKLLRLNLKGGLHIGTYKEPMNFRKVDVLGRIYYLYEQEKKFSWGAIACPTLEFTFSHCLGVSATGSYILGNRASAWGGEVGVLIGVLRERPGKNEP